MHIRVSALRLAIVALRLSPILFVLLDLLLVNQALVHLILLFFSAAGQDNHPDAFDVAHGEDLLGGERDLPIFANFVFLVEVLEYGLILVVFVLLI